MSEDIPGGYARSESMVLKIFTAAPEGFYDYGKGKPMPNGSHPPYSLPLYIHSWGQS